MDSNQRMVTWSSEWALVEGQVVCTECMRSQSIFESDTPFIHEPTCKAGDRTVSLPWVHLHEILDSERG
jgi:hypothetical protein